MSRRRKELYAISEEEEREKPLKFNVREPTGSSWTGCSRSPSLPPSYRRATNGLYGQGGVQPLALRGHEHGHSRRRATGTHPGLPPSKQYLWMDRYAWSSRGPVTAGPSLSPLRRHRAGDRNGPMAPPVLSARIRALTPWGPALCRLSAGPSSFR